MNGVKVGVVGATGYTGSETVRWLLGHPAVEQIRVVSSSRAGLPLAAAVPALAGFTDAVLEAPSDLGDCDVVFLATPHGVARTLEIGAPRVIDLSADHRHVDGWVYGQVEFHAEAIASASRIAVPGCFATAIELALAPLVQAGAVAGPVCVAAATGSTGSGAGPKAGTHHPERFSNLKAYKVLTHQHVPEILTFLESLGGQPGRLPHGAGLHFVPLSAPVDRGILATCFVPVTDVDVAALFADAYAAAPLVRLREGSPELRHVRGTALCDLSVHRDGDMAVVLAALDNLGKGAAAQAVQCFNLLLGLPVDTGLRSVPVTP